MSDKVATVSVIIAGCAFVASAVGVYFTYRTMRQQRIHDVKSIIPILHVGQWGYQNDLSRNPKKLWMGLAIVKKLSVRHQTSGEVRGNIYAWLPAETGFKCQL